MEKGISHSRHDESIESKARWFQSLSLSERMEMLSCFTEMILENNPTILTKPHAQPTWGRVRILSQA
ncbi:MAG: hypothetical protein JW725_00015 [Candidatus Babeliaceae bacterium]|nr:hypothetical protein [Candidatus Babeliaceae bacterium]